MRLRNTGHDVASILSATAMSIIAVGLVLGYQFNTLKDELSSWFSDASDQCRYAAVAEVHKDTQGTPISTSEVGDLEIINNRRQLLVMNEGGVSRASFVKDTMTFDPKRKTGYAENDTATVTLRKLDTKIWMLKGVFCDPKAGSTRGCPPASEIARFNREIERGFRNGLTIPDFKVNCGVDLIYGWIVAKKTDNIRPTVTPRPTATPRLTATPGPIVTQRPTVTPRPTNTPRPTATPRLSQPSVTSPIGGPGNGNGNLEVQVVALNYPQRTPLWDEDHVASHKPASCTRQGPTEDARPLYLNPFEVRATCISGGCREGRLTTVKVEKHKGYANFVGLEPGNYKLDMRSINRGYHEWPECKNTWQVTANQTNQQAVIILENETKGTYEHKTTEKLCKDVRGVPHIIEGLGGNSCYFVNGNQSKPNPINPTTVPPPPPGNQICKAVGQSCNDVYREKCFVNGSEGSKLCYKSGVCNEVGDVTKCTWGPGSYCEACVLKTGPVPTTPIGAPAKISVNIRTDSDNIKKVTVELEPCPSSGPCQQTATYTSKGTKQVQFNVVPTNVRYRVKIVDREIAYALSLHGVKVKAERCNGIVERIDKDYEICIVKAPSFAQMLVTEIKSINPPPAPQPPAQPPRQTKCGYDLKPNVANPNKRCFVACPDDPFKKHCSPDFLRPYFGKFGEEVLRQAAGICDNESKGHVQAMNDQCLSNQPKCKRGGPANCWTHDFSAGLFQINQVGVCVKSTYREGQSHGPSCSRLPGEDPYACLDKNGLRAFDGNVKSAVDYFERRNWEPWGYQCNP